MFLSTATSKGQVLRKKSYLCPHKAYKLLMITLSNIAVQLGKRVLYQDVNM